VSGIYVLQKHINSSKNYLFYFCYAAHNVYFREIQHQTSMTSNYGNFLQQLFVTSILVQLSKLFC